MRFEQLDHEGGMVSGSSHAAGSMLEGRVCDRCNGGWMSRLEVEARPIVLPLVNGAREPQALTESERGVLSRWVSKTLYVLSTSTRARLNVPVGHFRALVGRGGTAPGVVAALGRTSEPGHILTLQSASWSINSNRRRRDVLSAVARSYKSVLVVHHMIVGVGYLPRRLWEVQLRAGVHESLTSGASVRPRASKSGWTHAGAMADAVVFFVSMEGVERAPLA